MNKSTKNKHQKTRKKRIQKLKMINEEKKQLTKNSIIESMFILLNDHKINEIKISEIVKKAGISRASFYRYYNTKEEIIEDAFNSQIELIKNSLTKNLEKDWLTIINGFRKNKSYIDAIFKAGYSILLLDIFNRQFEKDNYYYIGWNGFIFNILYCWIKNDMKETDEELQTIIIDCTKKMSDAVINNNQE